MAYEPARRCIGSPIRSWRARRLSAARKGTMPTMRMIWICLLATACGSKGEDWTKRALKRVTASSEGIKFTIDVPDGMRQRDDSGGVQWDFLIDGRVYTPDITVRAGGYAKTLDEYVASEKNIDNWIRKEQLPDGYIA